MLTLSLTAGGKSNGNRNTRNGEKDKQSRRHDAREQRNADTAIAANGGASNSAGGDGGQEDSSQKRSWCLSGRAGEARLGLGQLRNDHVRKIELQAPLLLRGGEDGGGGGGGGYRSQLLLMKVADENSTNENCPKPLDQSTLTDCFRLL